ncbi:sporulation protein YqfC [Shouchella sp. JSM 1781072]|uniref:sporulation protein YqfC n=1 Tax=Bacillaceae TaxID=186817 RepID=UPI000C07A04B|nr:MULTISPECIES: sporulation protein YqfC [Bacillaceae]UTR07937.1 sporulation protein YqfC [Alkalihalobacillus sp. LMS6]
MNRLTNRIKKWVTEQMQLPADVMMDLPRITMIGQLHIYIENHRGVLQFSTTELRLLLKEGQLLVTGDQFVLKTILPEELLLEGRIDKVTFIQKEE